MRRWLGVPVRGARGVLALAGELAWVAVAGAAGVAHAAPAAPAASAASVAPAASAAASAAALAFAPAGTLTPQVAQQLADLPLHCIGVEYPNKTGHTINAEADARLSPRELHPAFFGCFDWHSSVHGHWSLVRLLKTQATLPRAAEIERVLAASFDAAKLQAEADYFRVYEQARLFERTYGWAWVLKLDAELATWDDPRGRAWHQAMAPLTAQILTLWRAYLPKQTYPNRSGVHPNTAFALGFAIDWARAVGDRAFEAELAAKARSFYVGDEAIPAHLEPDGADFFSPSLMSADLMARVLPQREYQRWLARYFTPKGLARVFEAPHISDLSDYYTVHLVGLSLSRAWAMQRIAAALPARHPLRARLQGAASKLTAQALPLVFGGNYGGDHWLASFALVALQGAQQQGPQRAP